MTPQELKNSILQLAIQGKLVEQRPEEGTAGELFDKIQEEKRQLVAEKKIKKEKPLPEITDDEKPFDIPNSWKWVRIPEIGTSSLGKTLNKSIDTGKEVNYLCSINVYWEGINLDQVKTAKFSAVDMEKYLLQKGDLLVCEGGDVGRSAVWDSDTEMYYQNALHCVRFYGGINPYFFRYCFELYKWNKILENASKGMTIKHLVQGSLHSILFPLPPLAEQKRIVAKIEELMPYIDRYEQAWNKLNALNRRFPDDMKKSILQYAIQGKLVEQRPEEGTAEELFAQIQEEKRRLIAENKIKKEKPLPEITDDEKPFDIPNSWKWVRLGNISTYNYRKVKVFANELTGDMWSLDLEDIEKGSGKLLNICKVSERKISGDKVRFYKGQVLYSKLRPYLKKILVAPDDGICSSEIVPFNLYGNIDSQYAVYFLKSPHADFIINSVTYGIKMPRVGTDTMIELSFPLPPLAEQKRIVEKLEQLLPMCEQLK